MVGLAVKINYLYLNIRHLLKKLKMNKMEYIWYCPRKSCNMIVTKTNNPALNSRQIYQCKRCNIKYRGDVLMIVNKENIEKTLNRTEKI